MQMLLVQGPYFKRNAVLDKIQIFMAPEKLVIMKAGEETKLHLKLQNNHKNPPQTTKTPRGKQNTVTVSTFPNKKTEPTQIELLMVCASYQFTLYWLLCAVRQYIHAAASRAAGRGKESSEKPQGSPSSMRIIFHIQWEVITFVKTSERLFIPQLLQNEETSRFWWCLSNYTRIDRSKSSPADVKWRGMQAGSRFFWFGFVC